MAQKQPESAGRTVHVVENNELSECVTLEVVEGPMDGAVLCSPSPQIRIGRGPGNDLVLALDKSVSGKHAIVAWDESLSSWVVTDLGSTNGTWVDIGRLKTPHVLTSGAELVAGHAVIRFTTGSKRASFLPKTDTLKGDTRRLIAALSPEAATIHGAAVAIAANEASMVLTGHHLLRAVGLIRPDLLVAEHTKAAKTVGRLAVGLSPAARWSGSRDWIGQLLKGATWTGEVASESAMDFSPRYLQVLSEGQAIAADSEREVLVAEDLVRGLFADPHSALVDSARQCGIEPDIIVESLAAITAKVPPGGRPPAAGPAVPPPLPAARPEVERFSTGDSDLDDQAQEAVRGLYSVAALYGMASAEERRDAFKHFISHQTASLEADQRRPFLEQLQRLLPIIEGTAASTSEVIRLRARLAQAQKLADELRKEPRRDGSASRLWHAVLDNLADRGEAMFEESDQIAAEHLADVYRFAISIETFIVGMVHNLLTQGSGTDSAQLPGFRTSIRRCGRKIAAGEPVRRQDVRDYMEAVERWLLVVTAAFHEGPRLWFEEFWAKVSPTAVEAHLSEAGWKRRLGMESIEHWNHYKELVHAISAELVSDEILRVVRRRAEDHFASLQKGKTRP